MKGVLVSIGNIIAQHYWHWSRLEVQVIFYIGKAAFEDFVVNE